MSVRGALHGHVSVHILRGITFRGRCILYEAGGFISAGTNPDGINLTILL